MTYTTGTVLKRSFSQITRQSARVLFCVSRGQKPTNRIKCNHYATTSAGNQDKSNSQVLVPPPPSWSINDLRLTMSPNDIDQLSHQDLATLARRCLIDIRRLSVERREQLRIDVAGVMQCASVLLDANISYSEGAAMKLSDEVVYDAPRGLTKIPIERETTDINQEDQDGWKQVGESRAVMQSQNVRSKTVSVGEDRYFYAVTKRDG